jgi:short-subunit dehydrogenase
MASFQDKTVVITGASSGLGRELAILFSAEGAAVVLAARDAGELARTAERCGEAGGKTLTVVTDVTREDDVAHLAERAVLFNGRIDVWINNAGVTLFASLTDATFEEHRRVIETNLYGAMLSARAVVPIFKRQSHGVMINVGSVLSKIGHPYVPSYAISKFALRGLSEALRVELADDPDIHVCSVFPYAMNTPHFASGGNRIGLRPHVLPPEQSPEKVARQIVRLAKRPRRELHVPRVAALGLALHGLMPNTVEALLLHALKRWHFEPGVQEPSPGNLYHPSHHGEDPPGLRDGIHGQRGPRVGTTRFFAWALGDVLASPARRALQKFSGLITFAASGPSSRATRPTSPRRAKQITEPPSPTPIMRAPQT